VIDEPVGLRRVDGTDSGIFRMRFNFKLYPKVRTTLGTIEGDIHRRADQYRHDDTW
jgi:hypothetical protein